MKKKFAFYFDKDMSGTFLIRLSQNGNQNVLTLLDKGQVRNFIIKKHVSST